MDALLSDELRSIQETARRFAAERIAPGYMAREKEACIDRSLIREIGALGLIAPEIPESMGGLGLPSLTSGLIAEAIGHADPNVAYLQILGSLNSKIIAAHASPELGRAVATENHCRRGGGLHRLDGAARRIGRS